MNTTYIIILAAVLIVCGFGIIAYIKSDEIKEWLNREDTKKKIRELCRIAEKLIVGTKMGQQRLEWVVKELRKYVPPSIRQYVTKEMLIKIINIVFDQIAVVTRDGSRKAL